MHLLFIYPQQTRDQTRENPAGSRKIKSDGQILLCSRCLFNFLEILPIRLMFLILLAVTTWICPTRYKLISSSHLPCRQHYNTHWSLVSNCAILKAKMNFPSFAFILHPARFPHTAWLSTFQLLSANYFTLMDLQLSPHKSGLGRWEIIKVLLLKREWFKLLLQSFVCAAVGPNSENNNNVLPKLILVTTVFLSFLHLSVKNGNDMHIWWMCDKNVMHSLKKVHFKYMAKELLVVSSECIHVLFFSPLCSDNCNV